MPWGHTLLLTISCHCCRHLPTVSGVSSPLGQSLGCVRRGPIANTGYTVSKMAQIRLVEYLNEQYGEQGLVSLAVHPGAVATNMAKGNTPEEFLPCKYFHHQPVISAYVTKADDIWW